MPALMPALALAVAAIAQGAAAGTFNTEAGIEYQYFPHDSLASANDYSGDAGLNVRLKYDTDFENNVKLAIDLYGNYDQQDEHRRRVDAKTFALAYTAGSTDFSVGVLTEFWGVTESRHLVDVLNQTVVADNIDEESKLGQPMVKAQFHQDWGNVQLYVLPLFRERIYASDEGRLRPGLVIDTHADYESSAEDKHVDYAARYTNTLDDWDLGVAYFRGTARDPLLRPAFTAQQQLVLRPYYAQIEQESIDVQRTNESLLLKLEAVSRTGDYNKRYFSSVVGFEYTQVGVANTAMDLGYLAEYLYDERDSKATTPFADDFFVGLRLVANDIAQSTYLLGAYIDRETDHYTLRFEMDTRLQDGLTLSLEGQAFGTQATNEMLYDFRNDDYLTLGLKWFF